MKKLICLLSLVASPVFAQCDLSSLPGNTLQVEFKESAPIGTIFQEASFISNILNGQTVQPRGRYEYNIPQSVQSHQTRNLALARTANNYYSLVVRTFSYGNLSDGVYAWSFTWAPPMPLTTIYSPEPNSGMKHITYFDCIP